MQILISVRQGTARGEEGAWRVTFSVFLNAVCLRGLKFVAAEGNSSSCVYVCPCGSVEYLGICSYGKHEVILIKEEGLCIRCVGSGRGCLRGY